MIGLLLLGLIPDTSLIPLTAHSRDAAQTRDLGWLGRNLGYQTHAGGPYIPLFALLQRSGTKPEISPRYAYIWKGKFGCKYVITHAYTNPYNCTT